MKTKAQFIKKPVTFLALLGMAAFTGIIFFFSFGNTAKENRPQDQTIRPVKVIKISPSAMEETRFFPGLVNATREAKLAFRVSGPLVDFDVRIGQHVKKGTTIARIDARDFEINVMRLTAALEEARANLKAMRRGARKEDLARIKAELVAAVSRLNDAKTNFKRHKNLLAGQAVSQARYDTAKTSLASAQANVEVLNQDLKKAKTGARIEEIEAAEARITRLKTDLTAARNALADTQLKTPFDGYVSRRYVENFENVRDGDPIVSYLDVTSVEVDTAVPEDLLIRQSLIHNINCILDAYPKQRFKATIKEIGRKTDSANQSYPLTVTLDVPDGLVVEPGMAATLQICVKAGGKMQNGFLLPAGAVFADPSGQSCVWRLDMMQMKVIKTPVTIGQLTGDTIHVLKGLESGDRVVTAGAKFLQAGQSVRILLEQEGKRS